MADKPTEFNQLMRRMHEHLTVLKLSRIKAIIDDEIRLATEKATPPSEVLERLLAAEREGLLNRRIERRIKESKVPERKLLADFDFVFQTGFNKAQVLELATLGFIERKQGLIIAGNSGTGKSHIAKAILLLACQRNYVCRYTTASEMLGDLLSSLADGTLPQRLKCYTKPDLLLIDEVGADRLEQESARNACLFYKVVEGRYCRNSTIMTTNIDFEQLGDYLGDPMITTCLVDRLVHHSIIINVEGPSWRSHESKKINQHRNAEKPQKALDTKNQSPKKGK